MRPAPLRLAVVAFFSCSSLSHSAFNIVDLYSILHFNFVVLLVYLYHNSIHTKSPPGREVPLASSPSLPSRCHSGQGDNATTAICPSFRPDGQ